MGLSWFVKDAEVTAQYFFHYLPNNIADNFKAPSKQAIDSLQQKLLDSKNTHSGTMIREYIDLCENQKTSVMCDLNLLVKRSFANSKLLKPPITQDFITNELEIIAEEILNIRKLLIGKE